MLSKMAPLFPVRWSLFLEHCDYIAIEPQFLKDIELPQVHN